MRHPFIKRRYSVERTETEQQKRRRLSSWAVAGNVDQLQAMAHTLSAHNLPFTQGSHILQTKEEATLDLKWAVAEVVIEKRLAESCGCLLWYKPPSRVWMLFRGNGQRLRNNNLLFKKQPADRTGESIAPPPPWKKQA